MTEAPFGSWMSPITADLIIGETIRLGSVVLDGGDTGWIEQRPSESGRAVIVRRHADGITRDIIPAPFSARTRVHEYGGGDFTLAGGTVWFANAADQRVYRTDGVGEPVPVTPVGAWRYADFALDGWRERLLCVREDHGTGGLEPTNALVALRLGGGADADSGLVLAAGADFYAAPRLSPDGRRLAWLEWRHPHMPWDETWLKVAEFADDGTLGEALVVAGGPGVSVVQPRWSPTGDLYFVDDRTGWWNLYRRHGDADTPVLAMAAEFARPLWNLGQSTYDFLDADRLLAAFTRNGLWYLASIEIESRTVTPFGQPCTDIATVLATDGRAVIAAGTVTEPMALIELSLTDGDVQVLRSTMSAAATLPPGCVSAAEPVTFPSTGGRTAHGFLYRPRNPEFSGPAGARPPLLVKIHGGPTAAASGTLNLGIQYWTSRGFAVLDVNYGGSTGYGTAYRRRLDGQWGVVDVEDCVAGAHFLAARGTVDGERMAITGGSAGGYSALCALTFHDVFKAGASSYGISDLEALMADTHKFEAHYTETLVGPWPAARDVYQARSPIHAADRLNCPMIFFQGLEDKVVPPPQTERMVEALRAKGIPVEYHAFPGEMHGFRKAETIKFCLEAELAFYGRVFGFTPDGSGG